jgi:hypothetical protein
MEKITIKRAHLDQMIKNIAKMRLQKEWRSEDSRPAVLNEPPLEMDSAVLDPKAETQVSDETMPIEDRDWVPGNVAELGKAMKQLSQSIPESQFEWFYSRLKRLVDKSIDQVDAERMQPRLDTMAVDEQ